MKYELLLINFSIAVCSFSSHIASAQTIFQKTIGGTDIDHGYFVEKTSEGGYIITGVTQSLGPGDQDIYLVKINSFGDTAWTKVYNDAINSHERANCVRQTSDGGYILTGTGIFSLADQFGDVFIMKTDMTGNVVWIKNYGSQIGDIGRDIIQTPDGGYIVVGETQFSNLGTYTDIFIIRTDINGDTLWTKIIEGSLNDWGRTILPTSDGGFVISGTTQSYGAGLSDVYLLKVNGNGNLVWARTFGGVNNDNGVTCRQTMDSGYIISGTQNFSPPGGGYVIKADSTGNIVWSKAYEAMLMEFILQTANGDYIIPAEIVYGPNYEISLMRTDNNGNPIWTRRIGGAMDDFLSSIQLTDDGGTIMTGLTSSFGSGNYDVYILKTDSNGNAGCNDSVMAPPLVTIPSTQASSPIPNVITSGFAVGTPSIMVSNGGALFTQCLIIGVAKPIIPDDRIYIFPNPATHELRIENKDFKINKVDIKSMMGELILTCINTRSTYISIDVSDCAPGLYFLTIKNLDGYKVIKRFIKM